MAREWTTTTTANDAVLNALISDMIVPAATAASVIANKVLSIDLPVGAPNSVTLPLNQSVLVEALSEGASQESNAHSTDGVTMTLAGVGANLDFTDELMEGGVAGFEQSVIAQAGRDFAAKMDTDLAALFSGFSTSVAGTSAAAMEIADFVKAQYLLALQNPQDFAMRSSYFGGTPFAGAFAVLHPVQILHLRQRLAASGASFIAGGNPNQLVTTGQPAMGYAGDLLGTPVFSSSLCPTSDASANRNGFLGVSSAIGIALRYVGKVETFRDVEARSTKVAITARYGVIEVKDAWGVRVRTSATA